MASNRELTGRETFAALCKELSDLAERTLGNAFKQAGDQDEREKLPILADLIKGIVGDDRWRRSPSQAVSDIILEAIGGMPEKVTGRAPGSPREATGTNAGVGKPERKVAELLYGWADELPVRYLEDGTEAGRTYKDNFLPAALELAGLEFASKRTQGRLTAVVREDLAYALLDLYEHRPTAPDEVLIERQDYLERVRQAVTSGHRVVCIWGEPGTGKTVLADMAARATASPVTTLRVGNPDVLRDDITNSLISEGMEPTNWSDSYSRAMLKRRLSGQDGRPRCRVLVIDNVDDEELIWQLIPETPGIPVFVTMRSKPQSPKLHPIEVEDFDEAQASAFISHNLSGLSDDETRSLTYVLGYRPLALDHATRFIRESPGMSVRELIDRLTLKRTDSLSLVMDRADRTKQLVTLYKLILSSVSANDAARPVLDTFLGITGKSGIGEVEELAFFLESDAGGSFDRIHFRAGLRALTPLGLLRENDTHLMMHPLTYEVLRDLRGAVPFEIEARYLSYLASPEIAELLNRETYDPAKLREGWQAAFLRAQTLMAANQLELPDTWVAVYMVDDLTWVAIREHRESGSTTTYIVRYEIYPHGLYKLDYRTGERSTPGSDELRQLGEAGGRYQDMAQRVAADIARWATGDTSTD